MRAFRHLIWLLGLGLLHSGCAPVVNIADLGDGGGDSGTVADGGGTGGDSGGTGACSANADCGANEMCGFPESLACTAVGKCFAVPQAECLLYSAGCACDGTEINVACTGLPTGYATRPFLHSGPCVDSGTVPDAGGDAAPTSCLTDTDCGSGKVCGYSESASCGAKGQCFTAMVGVYSCPADFGGCACDGTNVPTGCAAGLPSGYARKPLVHTGMCVDASPPTDAGHGDASGPCVTDSDCGPSSYCGYLESQACSAKGQCFPYAGGVQGCAGAAVTACSCDGTDVIWLTCDVNLPTGYTATPIAHEGSCVDASPPTDAGGTDAATPCSIDSDCASNEVCGFLESAACSAKGQCFPAPGPICASFLAGCACDGSEINIACTGLPNGYASKPLLHTGVCVDASPPVDAGGEPCASDTDCANSEICGFPASEACSAQGQCFVSAGSTCMAFSPGCACDGTTISVVCNGLPSGYETRPMRHTGTCLADGG